jgi:hypothetical protein
MPAHLIGVTGVPGSGKSHFARSARDLGQTAVAIPDPKEAAFYGPGVAVFADLDWRPHRAEFRATALQALLAWLDAQASGPAAFVIIDPFSEVSDLAMHEVLKVHGTDDPRALEYGRAYTGHDALIRNVVNEMRRLVARGKTVICTFHGKMKELEGAGDAKLKQGMAKTAEWTFDEQVLPVMNSSIRQTIHSPFDLWLYTKPLGFGVGRKWYLTAVADSVRPAKHSVCFKPGANPAQIPNTVRDLLSMLDDGAAPSA